MSTGTLVVITLFAIIGVGAACVATILIASVINGAPFVRTKRESLEAMLKHATIKKGMRAADLGSGDGQIVIALACHGIKADGYEINPWLVMKARRNIKKRRTSPQCSCLLEKFLAC